MGKEIKEYEQSFADLILEVLKTADPTGSMALIEKGAKYFDAKRTKRIYEFNQKLLADDAAEYDKERLRDGILSEDDYFSLLSAAINDDEEKKTTIYVTLYRNILKDNLPGEKYKVLKILKSLTYSALKLIQNVYIFQRYDIQDDDNSTYTLKSFLQPLSIDENYIFEIETLKQFGLLKVSVDVDGRSELTNTEYCLNVAELFFNAEELTPEAIGRKAWHTKIGFFSSLSDASNHGVKAITTLLNSIRIQQAFHRDYNAKIEAGMLFIKTILIVFEKENIPEETIESLKKMPHYIQVFKVTLEESLQDPIPDVGNELIYLNVEDEESKKSFLSHFERPIFDRLF